MAVEDTGFAAEMEAMFEEDLNSATEIVIEVGRVHSAAPRPRPRRGSPGRLAAGAVGLGSAVGAVTTLFFILVLGLFFAMEPRVYERGVQWMVPRAERHEFALTFDRMGFTLRRLLAGKLLGIQIAGKILKWEKGEASIIGGLLQTKALIMIIFANILLDKQIITNETFTALLLMAVASTMLSIPMVTPKLKKLAGLVSRSS